MGSATQLLVVYVLPALAAFFWFRWSNPPTKLDVPAQAILLLAFVVFLATMGWSTRWGAYGAYAWGAGIVLGVAAATPKLADVPLAHDYRDLVRTGGVVAGAVVLAIVGFTLAGRAREASAGGLSLASPLRGSGPYLVLEGGTGPFFGLAVDGSAQRFGIDVVKLDALGFRSTALWPTDPREFVVYDEPVTAPCDGRVLAAEDDHADLPPSQDDAASPLGNFVAIGCPDATVVLSQLRRGSVKTPKNITVHVGEPIGNVGASGRGGEARLRIFALRGQESAPSRLTSQGEGIPFVFGAGPVVRGDRLP